MGRRHPRHSQFEATTGVAGEERGEARQHAVPEHAVLEHPILGFVDPLARLAAEAPVPSAVPDEAELLSAAIASVRSHVRSHGLASWLASSATGPATGCWAPGSLGAICTGLL